MTLDFIEYVVLGSIEEIVEKSGKSNSFSVSDNINELGINDIELIKVILEIEKKLGIELFDNNFDFRQLGSIRNLVEYIDQYMKKNIADSGKSDEEMKW